MDPIESIRTAIDSLWQNKVRSGLTALGVIIGVLSVISLIALGEAAQTYIEKEFAVMGSNVVIVQPGKQETAGIFPISAGAEHPLTYQNAKEIKRRVPSVKGVSALVLGSGPVQYGERRRDTSIVGVTPDFEAVRQTRPNVGRFIQDRDIDKNARVCVLGTAVTHELFGDENPLNASISVNRSKHTVVGILEPKGMSLGMNLDDIVLIPIPSAQQLFHGGEDQLYEISVATNSREEIEAVSDTIHEVLYAAHDYTDDFTIIDQDGMLGTLGKIFDALEIMLASIAGIALLVGGIGIMNIMLVSVRERTREVGVRMAVGASRRDIGLQFLFESVTLSVGGGALGILLSWLGTIGMRIGYPEMPVSLSAWSVATALGFSLVVGVFFGVYPALKAAAVDPVEALRYE